MLLGYAVASVEFLKAMEFIQIKNHLRDLFIDKLESDFNILVPIGGYLVEPKLSPGQDLDGYYFHKLFNKKTVYLRPTTCLREFSPVSNSEIVNNSELPESFFVEENNNLTNIRETGREISLNVMNNDVDENASEAVEDKEEILNDTVLNDCPPDSLKEILINFRKEINEEVFSKFNVYRPKVYDSYLCTVKRKSFSPFNNVSVCFTDIDSNTEGAIDAGGPKREMFRLLLQYIKNSKIFTGADNNKYLINDKDAFLNRQYFETGRIIAMALIHCGMGPGFFSDFLFNMIIENKDLEPKLEDITCEEIKQEIKEAAFCENKETFSTKVIEGTFIKLAGWNNVIDFNKKNEIINGLCLTNYYEFI